MTAKRFDALLIGQHSDRSGPVGAPHAASEAKGIEDTAERIPDVTIREGLVRERASAADFHRNIIVGGQSQQFWQIGERLRGRRRLVRLRQAEMVDHQPRVGISRRQLPRPDRGARYTPD